jgi:hypothetical protein
MDLCELKEVTDWGGGGGQQNWTKMAPDQLINHYIM